MVMMARVSGSSEINRLSCLIKSFHQSFVNILIKSNLNRASQAGGDVTITSDTAIHHPGHPTPAISSLVTNQGLGNTLDPLVTLR